MTACGTFRPSNTIDLQRSSGRISLNETVWIVGGSLPPRASPWGLIGCGAGRRDPPFVVARSSVLLHPRGHVGGKASRASVDLCRRGGPYRHNRLQVEREYLAIRL